MCSWYLPMFLLGDGLLTLINMASFMVLVTPWDSLSMMEKMSSLNRGPVVLVWSRIGEVAPRWSLHLSPKVLPVSPMYSTVHPRWLHLYMYITPPLLVMFSLSLGSLKDSWWCCLPWGEPELPLYYRHFWSSHSGLYRREPPYRCCSPAVLVLACIGVSVVVLEIKMKVHFCL